ncbi:hypothetical protein U1Q18_038152, partial [Sarracenia purpurea var. burkii]
RIDMGQRMSIASRSMHMSDNVSDELEGGALMTEEGHIGNGVESMALTAAEAGDAMSEGYQTRRPIPSLLPLSFSSALNESAALTCPKRAS